MVARFVARLRAAHGRAAEAGCLPIADMRLAALALAEAALRYAEWPTATGSPPHIAVLGPTQTGKSTVVNLLLGQRVAAVSPLAGFTIHPQGFATVSLLPGPAWVAGLLPGWTRRSAEELRRTAEQRCFPITAPAGPGRTAVTEGQGEPEQAGQRGDADDDLPAYALTAPPPLSDTDGGPISWPPCVVWDTPDFDSLAARWYAAAVLEVAALADVHLLVLSKEKYSDLSVWQFLDLTAPLARPLLLCVNKLTADAEEAVVRSLRQRLAERGAAWGDVPIVTLPYDVALAAGDRSLAQYPGVAVLRRTLWDRLDAPGSDRARTVGEQPATLDPREADAPHPTAGGAPAATGRDADAPQAARHRAIRRAAGVRALVRRHWESWTEPVRAEHAAVAEWRATVAASGKAFVETYARDYLDHPQRYDAFRRATVELLNLLELPQVGGTIARVRRVLTWPARRLFTVGRAWWGERRRAAGRLHSLGVEAGVLVDTIETLLAGLQRDVARRARRADAGAAVWRALDEALEAERPRLQAGFEAGIRAHHRYVDEEVRAAARQLYDELQRHPVRLNALRTARATMDLGHILLAVKTGGLSALDAVWAPAAFAVSSFLMEGVAGLEMGRQQRQLKARQRAAIEEQFVQNVWLRELAALPARAANAGQLAITPEELAEATAALAAWEAGHV